MLIYGVLDRKLIVRFLFIGSGLEKCILKMTTLGPAIEHVISESISLFLRLAIIFAIHK
jgi:hypothetical protein